MNKDVYKQNVINQDIWKDWKPFGMKFDQNIRT